MKKRNATDSTMLEGLSRRRFIRRTTLARPAPPHFPSLMWGRSWARTIASTSPASAAVAKGTATRPMPPPAAANIVALCDVDELTLDQEDQAVRGKVPGPEASSTITANCWTKWARSIDAVTVSIPDHNHGVAAIRAMKMGKHCFCQKPLVQTVNEARIVRQLAQEKKSGDANGQPGQRGQRFAPGGRGAPGRRDRQAARIACLVQPPDLAPGPGPPRRRGPVPADAGLGVWLGPAPIAAVQEGRLSSVQMAGLV